MSQEPKSREDIKRLMPRNRLAAAERGSFVAKTLKMLAPVYGYHPANVIRVDKECGGRGLLQAFKEDATVGHLVPSNLIIGGVSGIVHTDLLCLNITKQGFFRKFSGYCQEFGKVVFVFPVSGSKNPWVIHNLEVPPDRRRHSIMLYAQERGGSHIQIIRIENFIKEFSDEQTTDN